jgi:hypothetical protein
MVQYFSLVDKILRQCRKWFDKNGQDVTPATINMARLSIDATVSNQVYQTQQKHMV